MTTFVSDSFTDTNAVQLPSHTPDTGSAWNSSTVIGSASTNLTIQSNRLSGASFTNAAALNSTTPSGADYEVSADVVWLLATGRGTQGVLGRGAGSFGGYEAMWDGNNNRWALQKWVGGSPTSLGTSADTYVQNATHTVKLGMVGTTITLYVDGVSKISVTDSAISAAGLAGVHHDCTLQNDANLDAFLAATAGGGGFDASVVPWAVDVPDALNLAVVGF